MASASNPSQPKPAPRDSEQDTKQSAPVPASSDTYRFRDFASI